MGGYNGQRMDGAEYFDDIMEQDRGLYGDAEGLTEYDRVDTKMTPEGIEVAMNCRNCGRPAKIVIEWPELFVAANGIVPSGWQPSAANGTMYPALTCPKCSERDTLCPHMTPDEAQRYLRSAASRNLVTQQQLAHWAQQIAPQGR
jgi:hypothetical protein